MNVVTVRYRGNFNHIEGFFKKMKMRRFMESLEACGKEGVAALSAATPVDTGLTAASWGYEVHSDGESYEIIWTNSNVNKYVNIALILQLGHGTRNGGWVEGIDYINPALKPVFDKFADKLWGEVVNA